MSGQPSWLAARNRRSPEMSSKPLPPGAGRSTTGWSIPDAASEARNSVRSASAKSRRGWNGLARICASGTRRSSLAAGASELGDEARGAWLLPMRASSPRPRRRGLSGVTKANQGDEKRRSMWTGSRRRAGRATSRVQRCGAAGGCGGGLGDALHELVCDLEIGLCAGGSDVIEDDGLAEAGSFR